MGNKRDIQNIFISTAPQKVLEFLVLNSDKEFYDSEIFRELETLSRSAVNKSLRALFSQGLIHRHQKGNITLNKLNTYNPEVKYYKLIVNIKNAKKILEPARGNISKAILFGSCASGENDSRSDIDLFIICDDTKKVKNKIHYSEKLQLIAKENTEAFVFKKENEEFWNQIEKGIVLWDKFEEYG